MKRALLCVTNPHDYINQLDDYSIMIVNPAAPESRKQYLFDHSDWSLKISNDGEHYRNGNDYHNERLFWYTSGTTGDSKFYSFTQDQLNTMAQTICNTYEITNNDRYVGIMPLWHAHGQGFYWATKLAGCECYFTTVKHIRDMPAHAPTFVTAVPDILNTIGQLELKNLRFIRGASAPMPADLFYHLKQKFSVPVIEAFGMTEALSHCFTNPIHGEQRVGTIGLPDGIEADIVDQQLYIRGPCLFQKDWFATGDLAERDQKGYYRILGRLRDRINLRGYKLDPETIERQMLIKIPDLENIIVFGNQAVNCIYTGLCDTEKVYKTLLDIHPGCRPQYLAKVDEIPISPSGKISRSWLIKYFNCN